MKSKSVFTLLLALVVLVSAEEDDEDDGIKHDMDASLADMEKNLPTMDYADRSKFEGKRKRRAVIKDHEKEKKTNKILHDMIIDDEYIKQMNELKEKAKEQAHIPDYLFVRFEYKDWLKRYKRELYKTYEELKQLAPNNILDETEKIFNNEGMNRQKEFFEFNNKNVKDGVQNRLDHDNERNEEFKNNEQNILDENNGEIRVDNKIFLNLFDQNEINMLEMEKNFPNNVHKEQLKRGKRFKRQITDHDQQKAEFQKQIADFEINQANIKNMIDKGIGLNMQKAMKISVDYALRSYVNTSSSLDESVQRFFIMKQEYMNLIDKWYHGVVIDLPNYLKSQERKKINLSFDDEQPNAEERIKLDKLNDYERTVDREFAEVGIHYGKVLLNNYCDLDDLFYKYHRDNNQVDIRTVFNEENTKKLLDNAKIAY